MDQDVKKWGLEGCLYHKEHYACTKVTTNQLRIVSSLCTSCFRSVLSVTKTLGFGTASSELILSYRSYLSLSRLLTSFSSFHIPLAAMT
jgi:hypothetical protein